MGFFSGIVKAVKKVVKSPIGKIALVAAGAYFGAPLIQGILPGAVGATTAATSGGLFSTLSTGLQAVSALSSVGGLLGDKSKESPAVSSQGGVSDADSLNSDAAAAAEEEEKKRKRSGALQNVSTSPLGLVDPGQSAAKLLLG